MLNLNTSTYIKWKMFNEINNNALIKCIIFIETCKKILSERIAIKPIVMMNLECFTKIYWEPKNKKYT